MLVWKITNFAYKNRKKRIEALAIFFSVKNINILLYKRVYQCFIFKIIFFGRGGVSLEVGLVWKITTFAYKNRKKRLEALAIFFFRKKKIATVLC